MRKHGCIIAFALVVLLPVATYKFAEWRFEMSRIPDGLSIHGAQYQSEESWGFGPGGNETGFVIYRLDEDQAEALIAKTAALANTASIEAATGKSEAVYGEWRQTPIDIRAVCV
jgi:hypothetical protein